MKRICDNEICQNLLTEVLKCLSSNFFYLINEKYSLQIVEMSKNVFV